jgi:hypothetical protein
MIANRIIQSILECDVDEAIAMSSQCFDALSSLQRSDIAYFEPRMQDEYGHFFRLATVYENLFSTANLKMAVLHRHGWNSDRNGWSGVFPVPDHVAGFGEISTQRQLMDVGQYFEHFYGECLKHTDASLAVFPTTRFLTILAAIRAVERNPMVVGAILGVMETSPAPDCDDHDLIESAFRSASEFIQTSQKAFMLFAESDSIRDYLLRCGFPADRVFVNPYPAANRFGDPHKGTEPSTPIHFGSLAGTREVHNPGLLATFLLNSTHHLLDWTVRINLEMAAAKLSLGIGELGDALRNANVRLLENRLENDEYDRTLQSLDAMLLLYGERYQTIGSGIFLESICAGVVPLLPVGSTMYRLYRQLGGQAAAIGDLSIEGIETAVKNCVREFVVLQGNASQVRRAWLSHEQGPLSWSRRVLAFVQNQAGG